MKKIGKKTNHDGEKMRFNVNDEVYWHDPDDDIASGYYNIIELNDYYCTLRNSIGSQTQAFYCELS